METLFETSYIYTYVHRSIGEEEGTASVEGTRMTIIYSIRGEPRNILRNGRESNSVPPPAPQKQRQGKGDGRESGVDPECQLPAAGSFTNPTVCVTRGDIRVQEGERWCAQNWRE